ncbi:MAG: hypothetical protein G01um101493_121 [Microgenomates group bacterium Gr01-1014_93]|nr:MAG: hypothetical protein G01um101493_121 [Microgenomates group bacterium Gr01-1014_93]
MAERRENNMKSRRELHDEAILVQWAGDAISDHMQSEKYWEIIRQLRLVHPDINQALDALVEHSHLDGRMRGLISAYEGKYPYIPSKLAKSCYERFFGRSLEEAAREIHSVEAE